MVVALALLACESTYAPVIGSLDTPQPQPYAAAQATLVYGQNQMEELSHQATMVGMEMAQAANAAEQETLDYNELQMMELSYQATAVSLNMAQAAATLQFITNQTQMVSNAATAESRAATAYMLSVTQNARAQAILDIYAAETAQANAATQQFITEQTQMVWNTTATAQSQAVTATYSAYLLNVTQTAQAQAILDIQATQAAQENATQRAYSLTATPGAAIQAGIERRALWDEFVITPLKAILITLVVLLLILGGVMAYRRLIPVLELRLRTIARRDESPLLLVDGIFVDSAADNRASTREMRLLKDPQHPGDETLQVEIIAPSEPSIVNWIVEAEMKLRADGWIHP